MPVVPAGTSAPLPNATACEPDAPLAVVLDHDAEGERLDRALAARLPDRSRSTVAQWIAAGLVTLGGRPVRASHRVRAGDVVHVRPAPLPRCDAVPQPIPLAVLFEDEHILVVDKPPGLVVHPAAGHPDGTLVNAVLHHTVIGADADPTRPGIVHRLDKDTSGVMVVAKTAAAREPLIRAFATHDLERRYLALAVGVPPDTVTYDTLHGRHPTDRKRFTTRVREGKRAVTEVRVLARLQGAALVECTLHTGRTHQIRVHLAEHGFPLLGDPVYGRTPRDPRLAAAARALGRQALHAAVLALRHPVTGRPMRFETTPPADFAAAVDALRDP
jgi:23S rRNA pseudouridine1911/1915/1917 synthase